LSQGKQVDALTPFGRREWEGMAGKQEIINRKCLINDTWDRDFLRKGKNEIIVQDFGDTIGGNTNAQVRTGG
jgi:hypothetical protein